MHELSPQIAKIVKTAYLLLPLGLASLAGLCLLVAAMRKALTGGAALALGGLAGVIVVGSLSLGTHNLSVNTEPASATLSAASEGSAADGSATTVAAMTGSLSGSPAAEPQDASAEVSPAIVKAATIGYALLPLVLAVLAGLSLLIMTFGKTLDGPSALALGGLAGVVVIGSVFSLRGPNSDPVLPFASPGNDGSSGKALVAVVAADGTQSAAPAAAADTITRDEFEQFKQELETGFGALNDNALELKNMVSAFGSGDAKQAADAEAQLTTIEASLANLSAKVTAAEGGAANATKAAKAAASAATEASNAAASAQAAADGAAKAAAAAMEKAMEKPVPAPAPTDDPAPATGDGG